MKYLAHLKHAAVAAAAVVVVIVPLILGSPAAQHFIEQHPADAAYVPIVLGILRAIVKAKKATPA